MPHERLRPEYLFDQDRIDALRSIAPEVFADGKINWSTLKEALGTQIEDDEADAEHFGLFWPGKREARRFASLPSTGTLVPAKGEGINEDSTGNIFIEGENLEVLKIIRKSYSGRIKMIYIDPPYNTGNDFVYDDDFSEPLHDYLKRTGQIDGEGRPLTTNKKADGRFHSKWLSMIYPRLRLARELLRTDGAIFISIDDNEVHHLRTLMNEVFGEENAIAEFIWAAGRKNDSKMASVSHEYILCYVKDLSYLKEHKITWQEKKKGLSDIYDVYNSLKTKYDTDYEKMTDKLKQWYKALDDSAPAKSHKHYSNIDFRGVYFPADISWVGGGGPQYPVYHPTTKKPVKNPSRGWMTPDPDKMKEWIDDERVHFGKDETTVPCIKAYLVDNEYQAPYSVFYKDGRSATKRLRKLLGADCFSNPKDEFIIQNIIEFSTDDKGIILDFFSGSGTTGHAVFERIVNHNSENRFILVQYPEPLDDTKKREKDNKTAIEFCDQHNFPRNISEISKERIRRTSKMYSSKFEDNPTMFDLGFKVFQLAPSHFKHWENYKGTSVEELESLFEDHTSPLVDDWKSIDDGLFTEVLLLEGFPLDSTVILLAEYTSNQVRRVECPFHENRLLICLDEQIERDTIDNLDLSENDTFICLDTAIDDQTKTILADKGLIKTI
jgi:adenine-specific DNA-methyltransferase